MNLNILTGPMGCGKSTLVTTTILSDLGRHLCAYPTIELLEEQARRLREGGFAVTAVHSQSGGKGPVAKQLSDLRASPQRDLAVLTTHETLLTADLSGFHGWRAWIDEVPQGVASGYVTSRHLIDLLAEHFDIVPQAEGWPKIAARATPAAIQALTREITDKSLSDLLRASQRHSGVRVRSRAWAEARASGAVAWKSVWSPLAMADFDEVTIAGASFGTSILGRIAAQEPGLTIKTTVLPALRTAQPIVDIHYFTAAHEGTTSWWETSEGGACLVAASRHLEARGGVGFWSGNDPVKTRLEHRFPGKLIKPKAAGLNSYRDETSCAYIYSSKATPDDHAIIEAFGITSDDILEAREDEDIRQFIGRGAIRNPDFGGVYDVFVYSERQAQALAVWLHDSGIARDFVLTPVVEAGIMDVVREPARPVVTMAERETRAANKKAGATKRQQKKRALDRLMASKGQLHR